MNSLKSIYFMLVMFLACNITPSISAMNPTEHSQPSSIEALIQKEYGFNPSPKDINAICKLANDLDKNDHKKGILNNTRKSLITTYTTNAGSSLAKKYITSACDIYREQVRKAEQNKLLEEERFKIQEELNKKHPPIKDIIEQCLVHLTGKTTERINMHVNWHKKLEDLSNGTTPRAHNIDVMDQIFQSAAYFAESEKINEPNSIFTQVIVKYGELKYTYISQQHIEEACRILLKNHYPLGFLFISKE